MKRSPTLFFFMPPIRNQIGFEHKGAQEKFTHVKKIALNQAWNVSQM
jgi:hypothetical protein